MGTHTYALLELSPAAYSEIRARLVSAGYEHAIHSDDGRAVIDMHGIGVTEQSTPPALEPVVVEHGAKLTDHGLLYAATARCAACSAGLAHPRDHALALQLRAWVCSAALKGEVPLDGHDSLSFGFSKIREETSINNRGGHTTRPPGTIARTVGQATCPTCKHVWQSEPYSACDLSHHWFPGSCPACGHAVGGSGTYRSGDGPRIETRFHDVVLTQEEVP